MIEVTGQVLGAEQVTARFSSAGERIRAALSDRVRRLGIVLQGKVKEEYLSGQSLNVRSGRLRRNVNEQLEETATEITSTVGTNVEYARPWELGFSGVEQVREHVRRTKNGSATVRAHSRSVHMEARPFLQPALGAMREQVRTELLAAATGAI